MFKPRDTYRLPGGGGWGGPSPTWGVNPPNGVMAFYNLKEALGKDDKFKLEFMESDGDVIKTFSNKKAFHLLMQRSICRYSMFFISTIKY